MKLPKILQNHIRDGNLLLVLGSGASTGALHVENKKIPMGLDLADLIADKFLDRSYKGKDLAHVAELAMSESSIYEVQKFIHDNFEKFQPNEFHKIIPLYKWSIIVTTNYDLIIERAYNVVENPAQNLVVFKKDGEHVEQKCRKSNSLMFLKLHGCITNIEDEDVPLILTPEQYLDCKKGRSRLYDRFYSFALEFPVLFVGSSLYDYDLRALIQYIDRIKFSKNRSFIINPKMCDIEKRFWESKKITCLELSFEDFLTEIKNNIDITSSKIEKAVLADFNIKTIDKNESISEPSDSLVSLLSNDFEYISSNYKPKELTPQLFYKGYFNDFTPIINDYDIPRDIIDDLLLEILLIEEVERINLVDFYVLRGHAGSGKSVLLRRLAWDATIDFDKFCLYSTNISTLRYEPIFELSRLINNRIFIFLDRINDHKDRIEDFLDEARKDKIPVTIIGGVRKNEWNSIKDDLEPFVTDFFDLEYLHEPEIEKLIEKLKKYDSLGYLKNLPYEKQKEELSKKAGRQLLVALHEATFGKPFKQIIHDEYQSISSPKAQSLYLTICMLHRLGVNTRAGLISRVHNIPFSSFKKEFFEPLEFVVFSYKDENINDYYYTSRHQHIAEMVFENELSDEEIKHNEYIRLIKSIDVDYSSDREAFIRLLNAKELSSTFGDKNLTRDIYSVAKERVPQDAKLMQQQAIFEMNANDGNLQVASDLLEEASKIAPYDKAIKHTLATLALKKSEIASHYLEKKKYWEKVKKISHDLIAMGTITSHPYYTLIKVNLHELEYYMDIGNDKPSIERKIQEIEKIISAATQTFPDNSYILDLDANLSELLDKQDKAILSLEDAFKTNKRNPYIASRLSKKHENDGNLTRAIEVLKQNLDLIPGNKIINFRLAKLLMQNDNPDRKEIKYLLRKSFTKGDANYSAQFLYACELYRSSQLVEANVIFKDLSDAKIDIRIKKTPKNVILDGKEQKIFSGIILSREKYYGFLQRDKTNDRIFTYYKSSCLELWKGLVPGDRVLFNLSFNYHGPFAINLQIE